MQPFPRRPDAACGIELERAFPVAQLPELDSSSPYGHLLLGDIIIILGILHGSSGGIQISLERRRWNSNDLDRFVKPILTRTSRLARGLGGRSVLLAGPGRSAWIFHR